MKNKVALITGGTRGIGLGIARRLAKEGWDLALNGVRAASDIGNVIDELSSDATTVIYSRGDIGNSTDRQQIVDRVIQKFGHINALVNNAGIAPKERGDLLDMSEESYDRVLDINLKGTFFLSQIIAKLMINYKNENAGFQSTIVNISSISAEVASINRGQYCISKSGMSMVTKLFASKLGDYNIPVYEVRPGIIDTDMTSGVKDKYDKLFKEGLSVQRRWGTAEDVGKAVAALLRQDFPYSTGQVIMVEGGMTIDRL